MRQENRYACGRDECCDLGTLSSVNKYLAKGEDISASSDLTIEEVINSSKITWQAVAVGKHHTVLCDNNGHLWSVGFGGCGQLGLRAYEIANNQSSMNK